MNLITDILSCLIDIMPPEDFEKMQAGDKILTNHIITRLMVPHDTISHHKTLFF